MASVASAQTAVRIDPATGSGPAWLKPLIRPYQARSVPPINLSNSSRSQSLIRSGNLYLSAQDVVALAIENNIDIEVQRYGPLLAQEILRRAKAAACCAASGWAWRRARRASVLQGVNVNGSGGQHRLRRQWRQLRRRYSDAAGARIPSLDPTISYFAQFQHPTSPQSNTVLTGTTALVQDSRTYQAQYSQNWSFGLNAQLTYASQHTKVNSHSSI